MDQLGGRKTNVILLHEHVSARRSHVRHAFLYDVAIGCFDHANARVPGQYVGHMAFVPRVEVLYYENRGREIGGKTAQHYY